MLRLTKKPAGIREMTLSPEIEKTMYLETQAFPDLANSQME
jgi:hypothetical protein